MHIPDETEQRRPAHLPALDGIRGLAVAIVVVHNSAWVMNTDSSVVTKAVSALTATGWAGVQLFFVLSGFLITGILVDSKSSTSYFRTFYIRRTLRIFPLYYACLIVALGVLPFWIADPNWLHAAAAQRWWLVAYLSNWTTAFELGVPGLTHFWSLAVEEQFYLVWPLVVYALTRSRLLALSLGLVMITPLVRYTLFAVGLPHGATYMFTIARWDALAIGAALALALRSPLVRAWCGRHARSIFVSSLLLLVAVAGKQRGFHSHDPVVAIIGQSLVALVSVGLIYYSATGEGAIGRWLVQALSYPVLRNLGKYSYAMYVFHFPIQMVLRPLALPIVNAVGGAERVGRLGVYLAMVMLLTWIAAQISWQLLEKPMLDWKERLTYGLHPL